MATFDSIVITGGRGMLARAIRLELARRNLHYVAVDVEDCDITNPSAVHRLFQQNKPTLLINCAAHTRVDQCEEEPEKADAINGHAVRGLAAAAREHRTTLIHFSTDFVFDGRLSRPYRIDDPVHPLSAYGRSKLLGEQKLQQNAPPHWLIIRTAWLYGIGGASFPRTMIERARQQLPLKVVNDQVGAPTYTADLAQATMTLLEKNASGLWHLTNSGHTTWFEFARATLEEFDLHTSLDPISTSKFLQMRPRQATRPAYSVLDLTPYERLTGRPPRPWREALRAYHAEVDATGAL